MKRILIIIFCVSLNCQANDNSVQYERALSATKKAILKIPSVRKTRKALERYTLKKINKIIPIDKETIAIVGSTALTLKQGRVDTKVIKKMNFKFLGGNMRPDLIYNFKDNTVRGFAMINWSF